MADSHRSESTLFRKLLAFQRNAPTIHKDGTANVGNGRPYKYATLPAVLDAVRPALTACGLVLTQAVDGQNLITRLADAETGETLESAFPLPLEGSWHQVGSAISYARRYAILAVLGLTADDDDDAAATLPQARNGHQSSHRRPEPTAEPEPCPECGETMTIGPKTGKPYCRPCWTASNGNRISGYTNGHSNGASHR